MTTTATIKNPPKKIWDTYKRILHYAKRYWWFFILGLIGTAMSSGVDAGLTWSLKPILDKGFIARDQEFIRWLPFLVLIAFLLRGVASFMSGFFITAVSRNVVMRFRQDIFDKLLVLPANYYDKTTSGQLLSLLIYNVDQVAAASSSTLIILVRETCFIAGLMVVMLCINWQMTLLFLLIAPCIGWAARYSSDKIRRYSRKLQEGMGDITHIAEEIVEGYREVRIYGGSNYERKKFAERIWDNRKREMQLLVTNQLASPVVQLMVSVVIAIAIYFATSSHSMITAGGFASMLAAMLAILKPLKNITTISNVIQKGVVGAEGIFELIDQRPEEDHGKLTIENPRGDISFSHVSFAYEKDNYVLKDVNLHIKSNTMLALVGKSGSGKSTLVKLLTRFYNHYEGTITLDGINIQEIELSNLRAQFAFVSQNVTLFHDTIYNNIAYGSLRHCSAEEVYAACKAAHAAEFIESLPDGYHTLIGENGILLSGGQRQRIAIARALLKNAPILILDEATSSLDTEAEVYIHQALETLMHHRTTIVIAHRLSTIEKADQIIVMDNGSIVETGTHEELLALKNHYERLYRKQFRATIETEVVTTITE